MKHLFEILDKLAVAWMNWRIQREVDTNPDMEQFKIEKWAISDEGANIVGQFPG